MPSTPAQFARISQFGRGAPLPVIKDAYQFPNALGWYQIFQIDVIEIPVDSVYGQPFITGYCAISPFISLESRIDEILDFQSTLDAEMSFKAKISPVMSFPSNIEESD